MKASPLILVAVSVWVLAGCTLGDTGFPPPPAVGPVRVEETGPAPPPWPDPPPATTVTPPGPGPECILDEDCPAAPSGICKRGTCVAGKCSTVAESPGATCSGGVCDTTGACVGHLAVVCVAAGKSFVGCDSLSRVAITYEGADGTTTCGDGGSSLGYCPPGSWCSVDGVAGKCQPITPCAACDETAQPYTCSWNFCDYSTGTCTTEHTAAGMECGSGCGGVSFGTCGACDGAGHCN